MLHHLSFAVADLARSAAFYDAILSELGYVRVWTHETAIGYGHPGSGDKFAIKFKSKVVVPADGFHVAFTAPSHEAVATFYKAALEHGGKDNGGAGLHPEFYSTAHSRFVNSRSSSPDTSR